MMRRNVNLLMGLLLIVTVISGAAEASPPHVGAPAFHVVVTILFLLVLGVHLWFNRKALLKQLAPSR